jgi:hypothetical protein
MKIINQPIKGGENAKDTLSPYSVLVDFYTAFNTQNYQLMEKNWRHTSEVSMSNPLGGVKRGWHEINAVYKKIFSGQANVYVEFYDYAIHSTDHMFLAVGKERGRLTVENKQIELAIRTTRIYVKSEGVWRQIHHHGSIENPELLSSYQEILLEKSQ